MTGKPAIEGGAPVRETFLPFSRPAISEAEIRAMAAAMRTGWLTMGPKVLEFEERFREHVGTRNAVAMSSCTAVLHTALHAAGVRPGDEVITSPFTFASTANVVAHLGAKPVFADIEPDTFNLDPALAEKAVTDRTRAIVPVHFGGHPCDMEPIAELATSHNLFLLEDAAHAFGARYRDRIIGSIGDVTAFSFYATKSLTTGEGGMATTNDDRLAERLRILRLHGIDRDAWKRYMAEGTWYYEVREAGFKYNLTDPQAAMGLVQLARADRLWRSRRRLAARLSKGLADVATITLPHERPGVTHAWHLYPILLDLARLRIDRARFIEALRAENIGSSVHFIPLHLQPYYQARFGYSKGDFPVAESTYERVVSLPLYPGMSRDDAQDVIDAVRKLAAFYG